MEHTKEYFYFIKIYEEKSISRAAKKLGVSQPFLSEYLKNLEKKYGFRLINRTAKKFELTACGEAFFRLSMNVINEEKKFEKNTFPLVNGVHKTINVGVGSSRAQMFLDLAVLNFLKKNPYVRFNIFEIKNENAEKILYDNTVDIVLHYGEINNRIFSIPLKREELFIINSKKISSDFANKWIVLRKGQKLREVCESYLKNDEISIECETIATALKYCLLGLGKTIVPDYVLNCLNSDNVQAKRILCDNYDRQLFASAINKDDFKRHVIIDFINEIARLYNE